MKSRFLRGKFLEVLSETPLINHACKKIGISRATMYRWLKDNPEFKNAVEEVLTIGRENVSDIAEGKLMKMIHEGNYKAVRFYLENNNARYMPKRTLFVPPPKHLHDLEPGDICEVCGLQEPRPRSFHEEKQFYKILGNKDEYTQEMYQKYLLEFYGKTPKGRKKLKKMLERKKRSAK